MNHIFLSFFIRKDSGTGDPGKGVAADIDVTAALDADARSHVDLHWVFVLRKAFFFPFSDVAVAKTVAGDRDAAALGTDPDGELVNESEGIGRDGASMRITEIDPAFQVVGDDIRTEGDAVAVAVKNDGCAIAFLDHVAGKDGAVGVFNDNPVAKVIVDVVSIHAEVVGIDTTEGILIFLKLISVYDDIVSGVNLYPGFFVVGEDGIGDTGILVTIHQGDAVAAMMIDRETVEKNLVDCFSVNAIATFLVSGNPEVAQLNAPESGFGILCAIRRTQDKSRFSCGIDVFDMGRGTRSLKARFGCGNDKRFCDLEGACG